VDAVSLLIALSLLGLIGFGLMAVAVVKTVRYHGWGKQTWAPPAIPWFITSLSVMVIGLVIGLVWALS
jgi:hypothetical protein